MNPIKLSSNFKLSDLTYSDTAKRLNINNNPNKEEFNNLIGVAKNILEPLYERYGVCYWISSGYRCEELNKAVGGAKGSTHITGSAVDLYPHENINSYDLAHRIKTSAKDYNKLIHEYAQNKNGVWRSWCHVEFNEENLHRKEDITMIKRLGKPAEYISGIIGWCPSEEG